MSHDAKRLIAALLERDPVKRLGANGADEIKRMPFFAKIDWKKCDSFVACWLDNILN